MKVLAFAASTSSTSINKALATSAGRLLSGLNPKIDVEVLDLNDFEVPLFSVDHETAHGSPDLVDKFFGLIGSADALIISFAEHNGTYSAAYKNLFDWCSRIEIELYQGKPTTMLATSPGPGGGQRVLGTATSSAEHFGAKLVASFSLPSFHQNFDTDAGEISEPTKAAELALVLEKLASALK